MASTRPALLAFLFLASCPNSGVIGQADLDECGDVRAPSRVYNGTLEPTYAPLATGQKWAIGWFGFCTGTLIAPEWVLTAEHCGVRTNSRFCVGKEPGDADTCLRIERVLDHPSADLTLVELEEPAQDRLPGIQPVPILTEPMAASWIGRTAEAAGYGQTETGSDGTRLFTAEPIIALGGGEITIDGEGERGVCWGDSGGPLLVLATDGSVRVGGALSWGDPSCLDKDRYARVDENIEWIEGLAGPAVVEGADCGTTGTLGRCIGSTAYWCDDDTLQVETCDHTCGWSDAEVGYRCITGPDPCGGVDGVGACDGEVARWCEEGVPRERDCGACAEICDMDLAAGGAVCAEDPCGGLDYHGQCDGDVAEWCDDGEYHSVDCADRNETCGWVNDNIGYYCQ